MGRDVLGWVAAAAVAVLLFSGCQRGAIGPENAAGPEDGLSGQEILAAVRQTYAAATEYSDRGLLYLAYRLHGRQYQEQQPWSVAWKRPGQLAAAWFNARVQCDGQRAGCFVYDIETGNLDNQWLTLDARGRLPLDELVSDPIARQFLTGFSELPLAGGPAARQDLIPPVLGLLEGRSWNLFDAPDVVVRLDDAAVDGRACHHLRLHWGDLESDVWIDRESLLVRQMTLPVALLDPAVRTTSEIGEVQFFARMHDCRFGLGPEMTAEGFRPKAPAAAQAVRHLVALPEEFPCDLVGHPLPPLELLRIADGRRLDWQTLAGRTGVLFWMPGLVDARTVDGLLACARQNPEVRVAAVFNREHSQSGSVAGPWYDDVRLGIAALGSQVECLFDENLAAMAEMKFHAAANTVVAGRDGSVQFSQDALREGWPERLAAAAGRVDAGQELAQEMRGDYEQYLETYRRRREMVAYREGGGGPDSPDRGSTAGEQQAVLFWTCSALKQPGNLVALDDGGVMAVEGWRSVARIGPDGNLAGIVTLDLPPGAAISRLRRQTGPEGERWAAFSVLGSAVHLFDEQWRPLRTLASPGGAARVLDVQPSWGADGAPGWLVAWERGGVQFFPDRGDPESATDRTCLALAVGRNGTVALVDGGIVRLGGGDESLVRDLVPTGLVALHEAGEAGSPAPVAVASGLSGSQLWVLRDVFPVPGRTGREAAIGPQLFDSQIEPLALGPGSAAVAVADSNGGIRVLDRQWNQIVRVERRGVTGISLGVHQRGECLMVAGAGLVQAYSIPSGRRLNPAIPAGLETPVRSGSPGRPPQLPRE